MNQDYYQILGLKPSATNQQIKRQFYLLAKQYHPDRLGDAIQISEESNHMNFDLINEAYSVLKDPQKRILYNLYGKKAVNIANYINVPITNVTLPKQKRFTLTIIFLILLILEHILKYPFVIIGMTIIHLLIIKQIPWKTTVVLMILTLIYTFVQYFYQFETAIVDHMFIFIEAIITLNDGKTFKWDHCFILWIILCIFNYFFPIHTPLGLGAFNISLSIVIILPSLLRICSTDSKDSKVIRYIMKIIYSVPDIQYGLLVLIFFWFIHGLINSLFGSSFEYLTITIQFLPLNKKPVSHIITSVTILLSLIVNKFFHPTLIYYLSTAVCHFLIISICIRVAGPSIKNALKSKSASKIKFIGRVINNPDCTELGDPQMTIEELCRDLSIKQPIEWEKEKRASRYKVLIFLAISTFIIEMMFSKKQMTMYYLRCLTIGYGFSISMFGFTEFLDLHQYHSKKK